MKKSSTKNASQQQKQAQRKSSSPAWLINWFSQLTKSTAKSSSSSSSNSSLSTTPSVILPWIRKQKAPPSSSVVVTNPISVPTIKYTPSSTDITSTSRPEKTPQQQHRPSITISLTPSIVSTERRNSQQTISSSDDQYSTTAASYYQRRDSSERSVLSELWSKARRRHPNYPRFHWPHRHTQSPSSSPPPPPPPQQQQQPQQQQPHVRVQPPATDDSISATAAATSFRNQFSRYPKRHSINSLDNTPSGSRPNSVVMSRSTSPNFASLLVKRPDQDDDDDDDDDNNNNNWLEDKENHSCRLFKRERWLINHELIKLAVDGLFSIPEMGALSPSIEKHVLQVGCGDAAWSIDVAIQYPRWMVVGLDDGDGSGGANGLSFKQSIPSNFKFIRQNSILQGLKILPDASFDLIALRLILLGCTFEHYQKLISECLRVCKPGGYIEVMEMDMRIYHQRVLSCSVTQLLNNKVIGVIESQSRDPRMARRLPDLVIEQEETTQIEVKYISLPLGVWGGLLGVMFRDDIHTLIKTYQPAIADQSQNLIRSDTELDHKVEIMNREFDSNRAFMNLHLMVIQKAMK